MSTREDYERAAEKAAHISHMTPPGSPAYAAPCDLDHWAALLQEAAERMTPTPERVLVVDNDHCLDCGKLARHHILASVRGKCPSGGRFPAPGEPSAEEGG